MNTSTEAMYMNESTTGGTEDMAPSSSSPVPGVPEETGWEVDHKDLGIIIACALVTLVMILAMIWCSWYDRKQKYHAHRKRRASRIPELNRSYDEISISTIHHDDVFLDSNHNKGVQMNQNGVNNKAFTPDAPQKTPQQSTRTRTITSPSIGDDERAAINNLNELIASCEQIPQDGSTTTPNGDAHGTFVEPRVSNGDVMSSTRSSENPPDVIPLTVVTQADVH